MSDFEIAAGETLIIDFGPVQTVNDSTVPPTVTAVNLRIAGNKLRFVAKPSKADADAAAIIDLAFQVGVTENNGIAVPVAGSNNNGTITIGGATTAALYDNARYLPWELWLYEASSARDSRIDYGTIKLGRPVLRSFP